MNNIIKNLPIIKQLSNRFCSLQTEINDIKYCDIVRLQNELNDIKKRVDSSNVAPNGFSSVSNRINKLGKIALFTTIIGNYDYLKIPNKIEKNIFDYYCITDDPNLTSNFWKIIYIDSNKYPQLEKLDKTRVARYIKTHPEVFFKKYKHSLFVDGNVYLKDNISKWIAEYLNDGDMLVTKHPTRYCIYDEANECIVLHKDNPDIIREQINKYRLDGYPSNNGLSMTNLVYRIHNEKIKKFDEDWWNEIKTYSKRDQLSFNYICYKENINFSSSPLSAYSNYFYMCTLHKNDMVLRDYNYYSTIPNELLAEEQKIWYKARTGESLDYNNLVTLADKLCYLKIFDCKPIKETLCDKYLVRDWIEKTVGKHILIPIYGIYNTFDDIDFSKLPNSFVMKCTHGSGMNVIVNDKIQLDIISTRQKFNNWLSINFAYLNGFEMQYRNVVPRIIIEQLLPIANQGYELKTFCYNGNPEIFAVRGENDFVNNTHSLAYFDRDWNEINIKNPPYKKFSKHFNKPSNFQEIVDVIKKLCKDFIFVRVDLYIINNNIYFGEMTFTPSSGVDQLYTRKYLTEDPMRSYLLKIK